MVATTHYDSLKTYASTTEGVVPAGFGFDPETFAPTYRLNYGSPGSSLALEIATRLGLPVVDHRAGARRSGPRASRSSPSTWRKSSATCRRSSTSAGWWPASAQTLDETAAKLQARERNFANREETFQKRLDERIEERLRDARREIDGVVDALKARTERLASDAEHRAARLIPTGETGGARAEARAAIDAIGEKLRTNPAERTAAASASDRPAGVGDRVLVGALGLEGVVQSVHDGSAEVDVRGKRLRAQIDDLRVVATAATVAAQSRGPRQRRSAAATRHAQRAQPDRQHRRRGAGPVSNGSSTRRWSPTRAALRIVHGYGTGQLRRAIAEFLQAHPFVANHGPAPENQGGGGVTVVELKE